MTSETGETKRWEGAAELSPLWRVRGMLGRLSACGRSVVLIPLCILPDTSRIAVWVHGHYLRSDECAPVITASLRLRGGITRPTLGQERAP
jgi:hypothetical protein